MSEFINAIRRELDALDAEIQADPRYEKMQRLRELLALYEPRPASRTSKPSVAHFAPKPTAGARTKADAMLRAIDDLLSANGQVHRSKILEGLQSRGIMGGEKNPMAHLAAFLSDHKDRFESDGKGNFQRREHSPLAGSLFENDPGQSLSGPAGVEIGA